VTNAFLTVTNLNDFNGPHQTTNLGVGSSNLSGRAISSFKFNTRALGQCACAHSVSIRPLSFGRRARCSADSRMLAGEWAHSGHLSGACVCPLLDHSEQRSILARDGLSANDPGCVKTSTSAARVEIFLRNCAMGSELLARIGHGSRKCGVKWVGHDVSFLRRC
jgi:hypothetical protein